jgi:multiple sugar transport system substrate-binding protein
MLLVAMLAAACGGGGGGSGSGGSSGGGASPGGGANGSGGGADAKPFAGKKITFYTANHPWAETIKELLPEFEDSTGMKVEIQGFAEDQLSQKLSVQLTSQSSDPDVFMTRPLQEARMYHRNGWYEMLNDYVERDKAEIDFDDFSSSAVDTTTVDGRIVAIPIISEQEVLYYRKDLLEKAGLEVPKTLDELEEAIKSLHDPDNGVYGFVARGQAQVLVTQVSSFVFSEGGDFMDGDKATVNTPEAIRGFSRYGGWLREYGPPGVLNFSWPQAMGVFAQGKAAFYTDASAIYKNAIDPDKSTVGEHVGYAMFPAGSAGQKPYSVTSWALAINSKSANKDAAWAFIKWAISKEVMLKTQQGGNPGVRHSVWDDPQGVTGFPEQLVEVIRESSKIGVGHDRPLVINVGQARDIIGSIVVQAMLGEDVQAAADKANAEFQALIDMEKQ